jgi:hypothetical protein
MHMAMDGYVNHHSYMYNLMYNCHMITIKSSILNVNYKLEVRRYSLGNAANRAAASANTLSGLQKANLLGTEELRMT